MIEPIRAVDSLEAKADAPFSRNFQYKEKPDVPIHS